jgi:hypothetical protein
VELGRDLPAEIVRCQLSDRTPPKLLADHRRALEHDAFGRIEPVEARREQGADARRNAQLDIASRRPATVQLDELTVVFQHPNDLFGEQRVPLRSLADADPDLGIERSAAEHVLSELGGFRVAQRLEQDRVC